jgi:hypothetical protein
VSARPAKGIGGRRRNRPADRHLQRALVDCRSRSRRRARSDGAGRSSRRSWKAWPNSTIRWPRTRAFRSMSHPAARPRSGASGLDFAGARQSARQRHQIHAVRWRGEGCGGGHARGRSAHRRRFNGPGIPAEASRARARALRATGREPAIRQAPASVSVWSRQLHGCTMRVSNSPTIKPGLKATLIFPGRVNRPAPPPRIAVSAPG